MEQEGAARDCRAAAPYAKPMKKLGALGRQHDHANEAQNAGEGQNSHRMPRCHKC